MKSLKIVLTSLLLTASIIGISAFVVSDYDSSAFVRVCYQYVGPQPATAIRVRLTSNWTQLVPAPSDAMINSAICPQTCKLCVICFDDATTTFLEAINILATWLESGGNFCEMSDPFVITSGSKAITVFLKN